MDQSGNAGMKCPVCGAANCACGGPAKLNYPPVGSGWDDADNQQTTEQENDDAQH